MSQENQNRLLTLKGKIKMSEKIVNWLIRQKAISTEEGELYAYAVHCLLSLLYPIVFAVGVGAIFGMVVEALVMIMPFILVRKFAGGFHADSLQKCLIISSIVITVSLEIAKIIDYSLILNAIYIAASVMLIVFSPIDSENKRLDYDDKIFCKKITMFIVLILLFIIEIFWMNGYRYYIKFIEIGIILAEMLQIIVKLKGAGLCIQNILQKIMNN